MALFTECMLSCAQNLIDTADIVREAIFGQKRVAFGSDFLLLLVRTSQISTSPIFPSAKV
ncbi:MAG: hypothetical protein DMG81_04805 [Acidobacteria bacterium]|nr:MAG: hypothetical protein DMG81_04805 [Acidobacteriota bacterium]